MRGGRSAPVVVVVDTLMDSSLLPLPSTLSLQEIVTRIQIRLGRRSQTKFFDCSSL